MRQMFFRRSARLAKKDLKELLQSLGVVFQETRVPLHKALTYCLFANEAPVLAGTAFNDFLREQSAKSSNETPSKETGELSKENYLDGAVGDVNEKQEEKDERADEQDAPEVEDAEKASAIGGNPPYGDDGDGDASDDVNRRESNRRASNRKHSVGTDERDSGHALSTFIKMYPNINDRYSGNADENFMVYVEVCGSATGGGKRCEQVRKCGSWKWQRAVKGLTCSCGQLLTLYAEYEKV
jgi:hypothetical protein